MSTENKLEWNFKAGKVCDGNDPLTYRYDDQKSIVIRLGEEEMILNKEKEIELPLAHSYEGMKTLAFYSRDLETANLLDEAEEDLKNEYRRISEELDLYEHVPTYDDSRAGQTYCAGESIAFFDNYLVLTTEYRMDM